MARVDYYNDPNAPKANSIAVAVSAFIQDEQGRILMIRRTDNNLYAIPGGQLELGETLVQAAVREVHEETGIECQVTGLVGIFSNPNHVIAYDDGEIRQEFSICFRANKVAGQLKTSSESKEVLWIADASLSEINIHPSIKLRINHALNEPRTPYFS